MAVVYRCCICVKFYRFYAPELPDGVSKKRRAEIKQWSCDEAENQDAIKWLCIEMFALVSNDD
ncbi:MULTISPECIES: hypothetical protein [Pseudomonas]|uniref:Uncharacterized protein n=1 Tax=Pseudomonas mercuritolerans TaxID=2951809 RepID=A0ABT2XQP6_9PSED|nr:MULTISPECIES: hypothetical protein [Pseudomonas]MBR7199857.1 hypothetical protein [Pseudomonas sp. 14A]MCV2220988.1 hypothetical protein [Pseudomonas mercuritolerans]